jgi:hypothetical protein
MSFKKKILAYRKVLEIMGHKVETPYETLDLKLSKKKHDKLKNDLDLIRANFSYVNRNDTIFVLNLSKSGIKNYIGPNSLIEMSFAYILKKKIYLLNPIPDMIYTDEIIAMHPIVINGDLRKIL